MNKIYKVVWSKVKHCYVVTSELAKRQTKGCGARSLRMAAVSVGVAAALLCSGAVLPIFGESVAEAKSTSERQGNKIVNTTTDYTTVFNFQYPEKSVTIGATEINEVTDAYGVFGNVAQRMKQQTTETVTFTVIDGSLIEVHDVEHLYIEPYQRVLAGHPFRFTNGEQPDVEEEINNSDGAKSDVSGYSVTVTGGTLQEVAGGLSNGGKVSNNTVNITGGTLAATAPNGAPTGGLVYGGYSEASNNTDSGDVTGNSVTIKSGTVVADIYGAETYAKGDSTSGKSGKAENNTVTIEGGAVTGSITGGYSVADHNVSGDVTGNKVEIKGGTLQTNSITFGGTRYSMQGVTKIYGGHTFGYDNDTDTTASGIAKENEVTISGGTLRDDTRVIGGHSNGNNAEHNTVTITNAYTGTVGNVIGGEAQLTATKNEVAINGGTAKVNVLGALSYAGTAGGDSAAAGNKAAVDSAVVEGNLIGGWSYTGDANYNEVTVKGSTSKIGNAYNENVAPIIGGLSGYYGTGITSETPNSGDAKNNTVTIENGNIDGSIYGGASITHTSKTSGDVTGNKVQINGGEVFNSVYGGYNHSGSADKTASNNEVTMDGGAVGDGVYGGWSLLGTAGQNKVTLNSGAKAGNVYGGWGGKTAEKNEVVINGGTVTADVYGGGGVIYYNSSRVGVETAAGNTVTVKDGTVKNVAGGSGIDLAQNNTVVIEDKGKVTSTVIGGDSAGGNIKNNTVTIKGGTVGNLVYAAQYASGSSGTITDNVINLIGNVTLGTYVHLRGLENYSRDDYEVANHSGNDLHVGGIKDGAAGVWQGLNGEGTVTNTVASVAKFDTIVYHSVKWDENVAALAATQYVENIGAIDISDLTFVGSASGGTMSLLKATNDGADLSTIKLNYSGGSGIDITTDGVVIGGGTPKTDTVNGVTVTATSSDKVLLAEDKKAINYSKGATTVSAITFGEFDIDAANAARDLTGSSFATANTVDAAGLTFKDTTNALKTNDSITLVTNATGIATAVANDEGKTIGINYTDDQKIAFTATATGNVTSAGGAVKYTVGSVAVSDIDVSNWNGTTSAVTATWATKDANVKTAGISVTGMNPGDIQPILTAASGSDFSNVTLDDSAWSEGGPITDTAVNGVTIAGKTTGGGVKVSDDKSQLVYQQDKKNVTGITLGAFDAAKAARSFGSGDDLTNADITIAASGFSISNLDATKPSVVVLDATNAIAGSDGATLKEFATQNVGDASPFEEKIDETVLTFSGTHQDALEQNEAKTQIVYKVGNKNVSDVKFDGTVAWNDSEAYYTNDANKYKFNGATNVDAENLKVAGTTEKALKKGDSMTLLSAEGMTAGTVTPQSDANKTASKVAVNYKDGQGITFTAEAKGEVKAEDAAVKYNVNEVKLTDVDLSGWTGSGSTVPDTWTAEDKSVAVNNAKAITVMPTSTQPILTAGSGMFEDVNVALAAVDFDPVTQNGVTLQGTRTNSIKTTQTNVANDTITYEIGKKDVKTIEIGSITWGGDALDGSGADYNYEAAAYKTESFDITNKTDVVAGESMALLKANESLQDMKKYVTIDYPDSYEPVPGVLMKGEITGKLSKSGNDIVLAATENKATALTFDKVEWTGDNPLIDHSKTLKNVSFDGATVDTSNIDFYKEMYIEADQTTTLVSDFGEDAKITPESTKYMVGTAFEGESETKLEGGNLILRTKTAAGVSEQTHKAVMAAEANMALLATGNEYVGQVLSGLGDPANAGRDGVSTAAAIGGGWNRYNTGSHVNVNSWNAAVGIGAKREWKNGLLEYGVFGEYGKGNYKLHSEVGSSDGDAHYAGGGLMAKWTNKHDVYTEASFRLGRMSDNANDLLRDSAGNAYGYDVHANYYGAHVGVGKEFRYKGGRSLDVYGKYFYTKRDGVEFDAKQHYKLDSVASSLLRIGARYGTTDKKWNWYGGLAYEYEFDGEATGTITGTVKDTAIRAASIKGSSVRAEFGMRMDATKTNPWQTDIRLYGYGGKHRGFGGNVNVAYTF